MKKIFIVTYGEYSDYKIVGVFDSKEKAELYVESFYGVNCGNGNHDDNWFADNYENNEIHLVANMWAKDEKHAIKIANERRVQYIANNTWGEIRLK